jgi:hypothetical protein
MLHASTLLSWLVQARSADEIERIRSEAVALNADEDGRLDLDAVARLGVPSEVAALSTKLSSTYGRSADACVEAVRGVGFACAWLCSQP